MKRISLVLSLSALLPVLGVISGTSRQAMACAACSCGDPTLVVMGAEQPFAGRLRMALQLSGRTLSLGDPLDGGEDLAEQQAGLAASYALRRWLTVSAALPVLRRTWTAADGHEDVVTGLGDGELRVKLLAWRDRSFAPRHLLALQAGALIPLSGGSGGHEPTPAAAPAWPAAAPPAWPRAALRPVRGHGGSHGDTGGAAADDTGGGNPVPKHGNTDHHLASHQAMPLLGASYSHFADAWSLYASATVHLPVAGDEDPRSLRTTLAGQYQMHPALALRLGVDTRLDGDTTPHGAAVGVDEASHAGFIAFLSPELVWSPAMDLVLVATVRVPVLDRVDDQDEGLVVALGAAYDL